MLVSTEWVMKYESLWLIQIRFVFTQKDAREFHLSCIFTCYLSNLSISNIRFKINITTNCLRGGPAISMISYFNCLYI